MHRLDATEYHQIAKIKTAKECFSCFSVLASEVKWSVLSLMSTAVAKLGQATCRQ